MSTTIDNRVVQMTFDNKEFEDGISQSLKSLQTLENSLDSKNFAKGFDISGITKPLEYLRTAFDPIAGAGIRAFTRLADAAVDQGARMLKALSIDNVAAGWEKFGQKTTSVGTLIAQGYDMETVTEQLERLNWYTDETSYNFTDMVNSIGKFTASGKGLEESVTAMEGIANWAALSGQNAATASHAMYQISQAMGAGYFRLEDYKSIQNYAMDTDEFRQKAIDAAIELGTLKKVADDTYQALDEDGSILATFNKAGFTTGLTKGQWFNSDVMMKVFNQYSAAVGQIYDYAQANGVTASEAMEQLGDDVDSFGLKALKAAQEARTFADVIDSVKDAASTGFMNTFELIIGNYEQATKVYTDMANTLYDVFAEPINQLNEFLEESLSGDDGKRLDLIQSLANIGTSLIETWNLVKESIMDVFEFNGFTPITVKQFQNAIDKMKEFTENMILQDDYIREKLEKTLVGIFSIIDIGFNIIKRVGKYVGKIIDFVKPGVDILFSFTAGVGDFFRILDNSINTIGFYQTFISEGWRPLAYAKIALDNMRKSLEKTFENNPRAKQFYDNLKLIFSTIEKYVGPAVDYMREKLTEFAEFSKNVFDSFLRVTLDISPDEPVNLEKVTQKMRDLLNVVKEFVAIKIGDIVAKLKFDTNIDFKSFTDGFKKILNIQAITEAIRGAFNKIKATFEKLKNLKIPDLKTLWINISAGLFYINSIILQLLTTTFLITALVNLVSIMASVAAVVGMLFGLVGLLISIQFKNVSEGLLYFAGAITIIIGVYYLLTKVNWKSDGITQAGIALTQLFLLMFLVMSTLKWIDGDAIEGAAKMFISFALSIALFAYTFAKIKEFLEANTSVEDMKNMAKAFGSMILIGGYLTAFAIMLSKLAPELPNTGLTILFLALAIEKITDVFKKLYDWYAEAEGFSWSSALEIAASFGAIMIAFGGAVALVAHNMHGFWQGVGAAFVISAFASAMNKILLSLAVLDGEHIDKVIKLTWSMAGLFGVIGIVTGVLSKIAENGVDVESITKALRGIMLSISLLGAVYWLMSLVPGGNLSARVFIMGVTVFGIYELIKNLAKINQNDLISATESFGLITTSIVALGLIMSYMSKINPLNLAVSAGALALAVVAIGAAMMEIANIGKEIPYIQMKNAIQMFAVLTLLMIGVAAAFAIMGLIDFRTILPSIAAFYVTYKLLAETLHRLTRTLDYGSVDSMLKGVGGFALLALTMVEIAAAFLILDQVKWHNPVATIAAMTLSIVAIAGALTVMSRYGGSDIQKAGFAAVLMGAALIEIAAAFAMMDQLQQNMGGTDRMVASFIALVGVMAIFAGIAYALSGVADKIAIVAIVMVVMAGALFLVGSAAALAGAGFEKFANGLAKLVENDNYKKFPDVLKEIAIGITQNAPLIAEAFITVIAESLRVLREGWAQIRDNVYFFIQEFFKMKISAFGAGIEALLEYISGNIERFTVMGMLILGGFLKGIEENIEWVTDEAVLVAVNFMNGLSKHMPELIEAGANLIESVMSGVSNKMNDINYQMKIAEDVWGFISGAFGFAAAWEVKKAEKWKELGKNLIEGIKKGLADAIPDLIAAADAPSKLFLTAMQKAFGIASPSKETYWIATMLVAGLHNGIVDKTQLGVDSAKYLADKTIDSFDGAMKAGLFGSMKQFSGEVEDAAKKIDEGGLKAAGSIIQNKVSNALKEQFGIDNLDDFFGFKTDISSLGIDDQMNNLLQKGDIEGYLKQFTNGMNVDEYLKEMDSVVSSTYTATDYMQDLNNLSQEFWGSAPTDNPYADKLYEIGDAAQYGSANIEQTMKDMESISGKSAVGIVTSAVGGAAEILNETQHSYRNMLHGYNLFRTDNDDLTSAQKRYSKLFFDDLREKLYSKTKEEPRLNNYLNTMSDNDWEQIFFKWYNYSRKNGNTEKSADMFSDEILGRLLDSAEKFEESGESFVNTLTPVVEAGKYNGSVSYDGEVTDRGTLKEMAYAYAAQQEAKEAANNKTANEVKSILSNLDTNFVNFTKRVFEANYGIVLDSGQLVGALTPGVDAALGANALLAKRG